MGRSVRSHFGSKQGEPDVWARDAQLTTYMEYKMKNGFEDDIPTFSGMRRDTRYMRWYQILLRECRPVGAAWADIDIIA